MSEIWKEVKGFEELYEVSNTGKVRNKINKKELTLCDNGNGYLRVSLHKNKNQYTKYIHRMVAESFINNPLNLPQVNHKDENKLNNNVDNLEWCDSLYNNNYNNKPLRVGEKIKVGIVQYTTDGEFIKEWKSATDVHNELGLSKTAIGNCLNGRSKSCGGYVWMY